MVEITHGGIWYPVENYLTQVFTLHLTEETYSGSLVILLIAILNET